MQWVSGVRAGRPGYGVMEAADGEPPRVRLVSALLVDQFADLKTLLAAGAAGAEAVGAVLRSAPVVALDDFSLLPPIPNPDKIFCIGLNYDAHRVETGRDPTERPTVFTRFADTLVGHRAPAWRPRQSDKMDYEGELAVVIGRGGRHIRAADALSHVAGYSCFNDFSIRDFQRHTSQFTPGKNFPRTGGFGPVLVTSDMLPDPGALFVRTRVNGEQVQGEPTSHMLFPVPVLIEYLSTFTYLSPGDVIATGTPSGVGARREPRLWLKPGDEVEVEIEGIGVLRNPIEAAPAGG